MSVKTCGCMCNDCRDNSHCCNAPCTIERFVEPMRYGVQYNPDTGSIDAGAVRQIGAMGVDAFVLRSDVTGYAIGAVAQWLIATSKHSPYQITDRAGNTYELTARLVES